MSWRFYPEVCQRKAAAWCGSLALVVMWLLSPLANAVVHSELDAREYRSIELASGLKVLLIQDMAAANLQWALSVQAGSATDPLAFPDLHRLAAIALQDVLGEVDYQISPRYAVFELPSYARQRSLEQVLPLLSPPQISEVSMAQAQQVLAETLRATSSVPAQQRQADVLAALASKLPPGQSVSIAPMASLSPALTRYLGNHYRPDRAALVVRSAASLDDMEARVKSVLSVAGPGEAAPLEFDAYAFSRDQLPIEVQVDAAAESPFLSFYFPLRQSVEVDADQSLAIFQYLITRQGKGSLLALLRALGWADGIDLQLRHKPSGDGFVVIDIALTSLGIRASAQIEALLFYVIDTVRQRGIDSWRFNELARAAQYQFQYRDAYAERSLTALAQRLQVAAPEQVLALPYRYGDFEPLTIQKTIAALRPDNVIVMLMSDGVAGDRVAGHSHTSYRVVKADEQHPDIKPEIKRRLSLPEANNFIPQKLTAKSTQLLPGPQSARVGGPVSLINKPRLQAWYQAGDSETSADASLFLRLIAHGSEASARDAIDNLLAVYLLAEKLRAELDEAIWAGVEYRLRPTVLGVDIEMSGYNSQLGLLLSRLGKVYDEPITSATNLKPAMAWLEAELNGSGAIARAFSNPQILWQYQPYWSRRELLEALASVDTQNWRAPLRAGALQLLVAGSLYRQEAQRLAAVAELTLLDDERDLPAAAQLVVAENGQPHGLERRQQQLQLYLQSGTSSARDYVFMRALAELLDGELISVGDELTGEATAPVAIRAQQQSVAGVAGLRITTSAEALTGPLLQALQARLAGQDIAERLAALKAEWRGQGAAAGRLAGNRWRYQSAWAQLLSPRPEDERAAVAALNIASVERYAERLFGASIELMTDIDGGMERYRRQFSSQNVGYQLPLEFPPLVLD